MQNKWASNICYLSTHKQITGKSTSLVYVLNLLRKLCDPGGHYWENDTVLERLIKVVKVLVVERKVPNKWANSLLTRFDQQFYRVQNATNWFCSWCTASFVPKRHGGKKEASNENIESFANTLVSRIQVT